MSRIRVGHLSAREQRGGDAAMLSWAEVRDVSVPLRRRFEAAGVSPGLAVRWCPHGSRTMTSRPTGDPVGWSPLRLVKFVEDVNAVPGLDGAAVLGRAVEIGLATDVASANRWHAWASAHPAEFAEAVMATGSVEAFTWWVASWEAGPVARPVEPGSPEDRKAVSAWVQMVGAFKASDAKAWPGVPAAGLDALACPFVPEGWEVFGPFVPWLVAAGYAPQNAPAMTGPAGVVEAVLLVRSAVPAWDSGVVDASQRWWSDDWYRAVGFPGVAAEVFRGVGWEPPLAAFLTRWMGKVQPKTLVSRLGGVPVPLLRRVWREGLVGLEPPSAQAATVVPWTDLTALVDAAGPEQAEAWLGRFGSVAVAARLAKWGLTPDLLARVDEAWPGRDLFRWVNGMPSNSQAFRDTAGWLDVAIETSTPGEAVPQDAHVGVVSSLPGWVADFQAAGVSNPHEALALVRSGADRDSLRILAALRG